MEFKGTSETHNTRPWDFPVPEDDTQYRTMSKKIATFPEKLYDLATSEEYSETCGFNAAGDAFAIHNVRTLEEGALPEYFYHCNYNSFVRQLNQYGFRKVREITATEFTHPNFRKGRLDLVKLIERKSSRGCGSRRARIVTSSPPPPPKRFSDAYHQEGRLSMSALECRGAQDALGAPPPLPSGVGASSLTAAAVLAPPSAAQPPFALPRYERDDEMDRLFKANWDMHLELRTLRARLQRTEQALAWAEDTAVDAMSAGLGRMQQVPAFASSSTSSCGVYERHLVPPGRDHVPFAPSCRRRHRIAPTVFGGLHPMSDLAGSTFEAGAAAAAAAAATSYPYHEGRNTTVAPTAISSSFGFCLDDDLARRHPGDHPHHPPHDTGVAPTLGQCATPSVSNEEMVQAFEGGGNGSTGASSTSSQANTYSAEESSGSDREGEGDEGAAHHHCYGKAAAATTTALPSKRGRHEALAPPLTYEMEERAKEGTERQSKSAPNERSLSETDMDFLITALA